MTPTEPRCTHSPNTRNTRERTCTFPRSDKGKRTNQRKLRWASPQENVAGHPSHQDCYGLEPKRQGSVESAGPTTTSANPKKLKGKTSIVSNIEMLDFSAGRLGCAIYLKFNKQLCLTVGSAPSRPPTYHWIGMWLS